MVEMKHPEILVRILLGGGIGSGKSIVGRRFERLGAIVIEADHLGHAVLETDGEAFAAVGERWPSVVVADRIDRSALAEIVFSDREQLTELEALTHPPIIHRMTEISSSAGDLVVEIPITLDVPGGWTKVFIDADEDVRLGRAVERGGSETDVRKRMASQPSRDEWMTWSDVKIDNNGSIEDLHRQIDALWHRLRTADCGPQP
jgi:dephospho-CoA kinase